ncbi:MAG: hypothetical protein WC544_03010 [Patescibacteria group bacterium]
MHQIRPFIEKVRTQHTLEKFPTEQGRIGFIHGVMREMTGDTNVMVAFTLEYLRQCKITASRKLVQTYLIKISSTKLIDSAITQLIRKGIVTEDKKTLEIQLSI